MDYVSYRAIFEGFQAHLWTQNSGRLLWMTHPSWPSNTWQIYSSDYDTAAAYYAVKKACEPLHAQLDLPDFRLAVSNTTRADAPNLSLLTRMVSLDNRELGQRIDRLDAPANSTSPLPALLDLGPVLAREGLVLVTLTLTDARGTVLSDNAYWQARTPADELRLNQLNAQPVAIAASTRPGNGPEDGAGDVAQRGTRVEVTLVNRGKLPILSAKLTVLDARGERLLPVYYSDNYVMLLPGEARHLQVVCPAAAARCTRIAVRGWNVIPQEVAIGVLSTSPAL